MKKISTYYFLGLTVANVFLGHFIAFFTSMMVRQYEIFLEVKPLPVATEFFVSYPWWPYVFVVLSLVGTLTSVFSRLKSSTLSHAIILNVSLEAFVLFCAMVAYAIPFVPILSPLG